MDNRGEGTGNENARLGDGRSGTAAAERRLRQATHLRIPWPRNGPAAACSCSSERPPLAVVAVPQPHLVRPRRIARK